MNNLPISSVWSYNFLVYTIPVVSRFFFQDVAFCYLGWRYRYPDLIIKGRLIPFASTSVSPDFVVRFFVAHLFSFLCCGFCLICLYSSCVLCAQCLPVYLYCPFLIVLRFFLTFIYPVL